MSRRIELLLSRKETFPINPCSLGCMEVMKGWEEEEELLHPREGGEVQRGCVCVYVYVTVCACTSTCACLL